MLDLHAAESLEDLAAQCGPATTTRLARLMLRVFATLGATEDWDFLPDLAEDLARAAQQLGLTISGPPPDPDLKAWERIAEPLTLPSRPPVTADGETLALALHEFARKWTPSVLADDLSGKLTCFELDALADLLAAIGEEPAARAWTTSHAMHDEEGDSHYTG